MTVIKLDKNTYQTTIAGEKITIKTTSAGYIYYISETYGKITKHNQYVTQLKWRLFCN